MPHVFLSDDWYAEYERLQQGVEIPAALRELVANLYVKMRDGREIKAHFRDGFVYPEHVENPMATITASDAITYKVLIEGDVKTALPAVFNGQLKVQGDKAALIKLGMTPDTESQKAFREQLKEVTLID